MLPVYSHRKKLIFLTILALSLYFSLCYAEVKKDNLTGELEITGTIIDNRNAEKYHDKLDRFIPMYPKMEAVLPINAQTGYSVYSDGELYKFDEDSNKRIIEFLKKRENILKVVVRAKEKNGKLELLSIKNQYPTIRKIKPFTIKMPWWRAKEE